MSLNTMLKIVEAKEKYGAKNSKSFRAGYNKTKDNIKCWAIGCKNHPDYLVTRNWGKVDQCYVCSKHLPNGGQSNKWYFIEKIEKGVL